MDPQFRRSQSALRAAIYELASTRSPTDVSVTELCRAAGVTRETFYRHASSPLQLLADALDAEIARLPRAWGKAVAVQDPARLFPDTARAILRHVALHAEVYRAAMQPGLLSPLRTNLEQMMRPTLVEYLQVHPEVIPEPVDPSDTAGLGVLASYAASGCVGAIEWWLKEPVLDLDRGVRLLIAATPAFWMSRTNLSEPMGAPEGGNSASL